MVKGQKASKKARWNMHLAHVGKRLTEDHKQKLRKPNPKRARQFCSKGHNTHLVGRSSSHNCTLCRYITDAINRNWSFDLTEDQFVNIISQKCVHSCTECSSTGIDRVDSSKGYTVDNVQPMCGRHNKMKLTLCNGVFKILCSGVK